MNWSYPTLFRADLCTWKLPNSYNFLILSENHFSGDLYIHIWSMLPNPSADWPKFLEKFGFGILQFPKQVTFFEVLKHCLFFGISQCVCHIS